MICLFYLLVDCCLFVDCLPSVAALGALPWPATSAAALAFASAAALALAAALVILLYLLLCCYLKFGYICCHNCYVFICVFLLAAALAMPSVAALAIASAAALALPSAAASAACRGALIKRNILITEGSSLIISQRKNISK